MNSKLFPLIVIVVCSLIPGIGLAKDKVPVPYAPLPVESPSVDSYIIGTDTVTDLVTDLVWQRSDDGAYRDWDEAWSYCQGLTLPVVDGFEDWRLPGVAELMSIVHYGNSDPAINTTAFTDPGDSFYWSATTYADYSGNAWGVLFDEGYVGFNPKSTSNGFLVRCVRGRYACSGNFKDNGNGTVTDLATGLMWQQEDDNAQRNWADANSFCDDLDLGGKKDWRLPTIKELYSTVNCRVNDLTVYITAFPNTDPDAYWSATTRADDGASAWTASFIDGTVNWYDKSTPLYARCVR